MSSRRTSRSQQNSTPPPASWHQKHASSGLHKVSSFANARPPNLNGVVRNPVKLYSTRQENSNARFSKPDSTKNVNQSHATMQMTRYLEAENIKRQIGERIAQQCFTASTVQECNEARPKPSKIPAQFQDDRQFAADRVRSQYVDEVRECYSYISEQYDPVLRDKEHELDKKRQSLLERKAREDEIKIAEMRREAELDLKRHELLKKKERKKSRKKGRKKETGHSVEQTASDHINRTSVLAKYGNNKNTSMTMLAPAPPTFAKPDRATNVAKDMRTHEHTPAPPQSEKLEPGSMQQRLRRLNTKNMTL